MKLRIRGNSVRLRLTRSEVDAIADGRPVVETTAFPGGALEYRVQRGPSPTPHATFEGGVVTVELPDADGLQWAQTEQVGIEATQGEGDDALRILVEKDFQCLAPREGEDDTDAFPHPNADGPGC